jgi:ATP-dependent Clp protease adaptor protein ClpS
LPKIEFETKHEVDLQEPPQYKVLLLNDNYSTMEFVIEVLIKVFHKSLKDAEKIMLDVHNNGKGLCGIYSHEIAHMKVYQVKSLARASGFPLLATMEEI